MGTKLSLDITSAVAALKEIYEDYPFFEPYYAVAGAKDELISRIKKLSKVEKAVYGIEEDEGD